MILLLHAAVRASERVEFLPRCGRHERRSLRPHIRGGRQLHSSREDYNVGSERMGKLHAHVPQFVESDHANFLALADAPMAHRRVHCDSGAKQRSSTGKLQVCPMLLFSNEIADELNEFFKGEE